MPPGNDFLQHLDKCDVKIGVSGTTLSYSLQAKPSLTCSLSSFDKFSTLSGLFKGLTLSFLVLNGNQLAIPAALLEQGLYSEINEAVLELWSVILPLKLDKKTPNRPEGSIYNTECGER